MQRIERDTDGENDMRLGRDEVLEYVRSVGSEHFDDSDEVRDGADQVFENLDTKKDGKISVDEISMYWHSLESLSTPADIAYWLRYSVLLPQYENVFLEHQITGHDLPTLLQDNFYMLGIVDEEHLEKLSGSIVMRLFGMATEPGHVENLSCSPRGHGHARLAWSTPTETGNVRPHLYELRRRESKLGLWRSVGVLAETAMDVNAAGEYMVRAFNLLGAGPWSMPCQCRKLSTTTRWTMPTSLARIEETTEGTNNGRLTRDEIRQYISRLGRNQASLDETPEVEDAVEVIIPRLDYDGDGEISTLEMEIWTSSLLKTKEDVADYVSFSLQLPQYRDIFLSEHVTGSELPDLVAHNGKLLREHLGITNDIHVRKIRRFVKLLRIAAEADVLVYIARYRAAGQDNQGWAYSDQRWSGAADLGGVKSLQIDETSLRSEAIIEISVKAWNAYGGSEWSEHVSFVPLVLVLLCTVGSSTASSGDDIVVVDFSQATTNPFTEKNDPIMGGKSTGNFTVSNGLGIFQGRVVDVPFLHAPGFIKAETGSSIEYPDVSSCSALFIEARSLTSYQGYRFSFGNAHPPGGKFFAFGFKTNFTAPMDSFERIVLPFDTFSDLWDDATGKIITTCKEDKKYCPDEATLKDMKTVSIWGEGVGGNVHLLIKKIGATQCKVTKK
eukprot:g2810.t1